MTSPSNHRAVPALLALLQLLTLAACSGASSGGNSGTLSGITLQPGAAPSIAVDGTVRVGANGAYQGSAGKISYKDVTSSSTWSSSDTSVATVKNGLVTGTGIGTATITASLEGKTGTTKVAVGQTLTLEVTPTVAGTFSVSADSNRQFQALAHYPDGTVLDLTVYTVWSSNNSGVLLFYDPSDYTHAPGDAALVSTGTATVTATLDLEHLGSFGVTVYP
jgi:trimeric autotransporter adhesin